MKKIVLFLFVLSSMFLSCGKGPASFSAKVFDQYPGTRNMDLFQLYVKGDSYTIEKLSDQKSLVVIYNADKDIMWEVNHKAKVYRVTDGKTTFDDDPLFAMESIAKEYSPEKAIDDSVLNMDAERIDYSFNGKTKLKKWISKEYNFPIKYQLFDKEYERVFREVEVKRIKSEELSDSLFIIPEDYMEKSSI